MNNSTHNLKVLSLVLALAVILLGAGCLYLGNELVAYRSEVANQNINAKTLAFTKLFIEKVLRADTEVDFETRLSLENAVRGLDNEAILVEWQKFTESKTEADAQREVKNLLQLLVDNISVH